MTRSRKRLDRRGNTPRGSQKQPLAERRESINRPPGSGILSDKDLDHGANASAPDADDRLVRQAAKRDDSHASRNFEDWRLVLVKWVGSDDRAIQKTFQVAFLVAVLGLVIVGLAAGLLWVIYAVVGLPGLAGLSGLGGAGVLVGTRSRRRQR